MTLSMQPRQCATVAPAIASLQWKDLSDEIEILTNRWQKGEVSNFVPDAWLAQATALPGIDPSSLAYLSRILRERGRITLQHARFFTRIESDLRQRRIDELKVAPAGIPAPSARRLSASSVDAAV